MSLITFIITPVYSKICYNFSIFSKKKIILKSKRMDLKKLLYKMLVKYYLNDNIKAQFENFALDLRNAWTNLIHTHGF